MAYIVKQEIMDRLLGLLGGLVIGIVICAIIRFTMGLGLTIIPLGILFVQLSPGIISGGILGVIFPRVFKYGLFVFLIIPGGGGS